jgi:hypothetical protein
MLPADQAILDSGGQFRQEPSTPERFASLHQERRDRALGNDQRKFGRHVQRAIIFSTVRARKTPDIQAFMCRMTEVSRRDRGALILFRPDQYVT